MNKLIGCCGLDCEKCDARCNDSKRQCLARKNLRPVDKAERRNDNA